MLEHHYLEFWVVKPSDKLILGSLMHSIIQLKWSIVLVLGVPLASCIKTW